MSEAHFLFSNSAVNVPDSQAYRNIDMIRKYISFNKTRDLLFPFLGWSCGAMVLDKLQVQSVLLIWIIVGQGPTALAIGAGGGSLDIFVSHLTSSLLSPSFRKAARYRLQYCHKKDVKPKTTSQRNVSIPYCLQLCGSWSGLCNS